jgi:hypothetical protein
MEELTCKAAVLTDVRDWGNDSHANAVASEIRELSQLLSTRELKITHLDKWPSLQDGCYIIVVRLIRDNTPHEAFNWYLSEFSKWRMGTPPETSMVYIDKKYPSNSLTNPFERGFQGVIGLHSKVAYSIKFGAPLPDFSDLAARSFLQFYANYDESNIPNRLQRNPTYWKFDLIKLLLERYCPNRYQWNKEHSPAAGKSGSAGKDEIAFEDIPVTVVGIDETLRDIFKPLETLIPSSEEDCSETVAYGTKLTWPLKKEIQFPIPKKVRFRFGNSQKQEKPNILVLGQKPTSSYVPTFGDYGRKSSARALTGNTHVFQHIVVDPGKTKVKIEGNTLISPNNPFVVWDCIWEAVFSDNTTDTVKRISNIERK